MINGYDWSGWSTVTDANVMFVQPDVIDIAYVRGFDGFRDDVKFTSNRNILRAATNPNGAVLWSAYMFLGYSAQVGSMTWNAAGGSAQAGNFWSLITAGGREFQLPAAIDVERNAWIDDNGVRQTVPLPSVVSYCATYLLPAIDYLTKAMGRRPLLYSNPDMILNYLSPVLNKPGYEAITECPLWLADYNAVKPDGNPSYWARVSAYWPKWLMHQYKGDDRSRPGISDVDLNRCQGTRAQWKAWAADATKPLPQEGATDPIPPDPTPDPTPDPDIAAQLAAINAKLDALAVDVATIRSHFRP